MVLFKFERWSDGGRGRGRGGHETHYDLSAVPDGADLTKLSSPTSLQKG